jgi:hypothetical protein
MKEADRETESQLDRTRQSLFRELDRRVVFPISDQALDLLPRNVEFLSSFLCIRERPLKVFPGGAWVLARPPHELKEESNRRSEARHLGNLLQVRKHLVSDQRGPLRDQALELIWRLDALDRICEQRELRILIALGFFAAAPLTIAFPLSHGLLM